MEEGRLVVDVFLLAAASFWIAEMDAKEGGPVLFSAAS